MFFFLFFSAFFGSEIVELHFRSNKGGWVWAGRENPHIFPPPSPELLFHCVWALGKGLAGLRELLGFSQGSLSHRCNSGLWCPGVFHVGSGCPTEQVAPWGTCPTGLGSSGSITGQLRDLCTWIHQIVMSCIKKKKITVLERVPVFCRSWEMKAEAPSWGVVRNTSFVLGWQSNQVSVSLWRKSLPSGRTYSGSFSVDMGLPACGASHSVLGTEAERYRQSTRRLEKSNKKD